MFYKNFVEINGLIQYTIKSKINNIILLEQ